MEEPIYKNVEINERKKRLNRKLIFESAPFIGLIGLILAYVAVSGGNISFYNLEIIINQSVILTVVAIGAVFIFSLGSFDISLGASMAVSGMIGVIVFNKTESFAIMLIACLVVGVLVGMVNSLLSAIFNLPAFVSTIAMLSILTSLVDLILDGNTNISLAGSTFEIDNLVMKLGILIVFFSVAFYLFNKTAVGRKNKFLGSNPVAGQQTGISIVKQTIYSFCFSGIGVGLAAFLTILRAPTLSKSTGGSIGMDVLIAIVFGGMAVSGGARSKISAAVVGGLSITILNQVLLLLGASFGMTQLVKGVMFLIVVFVVSLNYRTKLLPR